MQSVAFVRIKYSGLNSTVIWIYTKVFEKNVLNIAVLCTINVFSQFLNYYNIRSQMIFLDMFICSFSDTSDLLKHEIDHVPFHNTLKLLRVAQ